MLQTTETSLRIPRFFKLRQIITYQPREITIMDLRRQGILNEIEILKPTNKSIIYENQENIDKEVVHALSDRKIINIMVLSKTQSGKTGSMCATINYFLEDRSNYIPVENIYIITGYSSIEWKSQTIESMPESLEKRVYHRSDLPNTLSTEIKQKKNILIITDEIQIAAKNTQTLIKSFSKAGLLNKESLYERDIKVLEYTATPDGTVYDHMSWRDASKKILAREGRGYIDSYDLLTQGRVFQFADLCGYDPEDETPLYVINNIMEIKELLTKYDNPMYHIIRTKNRRVT